MLRFPTTTLGTCRSIPATFIWLVFSSVKPEQFKKEPNLRMVVNYINTVLGSVVPDYPVFSGKMWSVLEEEIRIRECMFSLITISTIKVFLYSGDIYSYIEGEADAFSEDGIMYVSSLNQCFQFWSENLTDGQWITSFSTKNSDDWSSWHVAVLGMTL